MPHPWRRWSVASAITVAGIAAVVVTFGVQVWCRRWITDDGLIYVRVARQIVYGYGPVYNVFERTEPTTSTLWTWLLAAVQAIAPGDLAPKSVFIGGLLSVFGMVVALDATRRWHRARGATAPLLPFASLIALAVFPFWDYATSGLETGLTTCWLAIVWWLLVTLRPEVSRRRQIVLAFVYGLGPLVRPDLAIASLVFLVGAWRLVRPARRRTLLLLVIAFALPAVYEVFRIGYYGILVPLPALAKSAGSAEWGRGLRYLNDFVVDYDLWLPLVAAAIAFGFVLARRMIKGTDRVVIATPIVSGILLMTYVVRVGGDFMHGRMLLPPLFVLVMPALLVPLSRLTAPLVAAVAIWATMIGISVRTKPGLDWYADWDERRTYVQGTRDPHPTTTLAHVRISRALRRFLSASQQNLRLMIWDVNGVATPIDPAIDAPVVIAAGWLGSAGAIAPLDGIAADLYGLADPIAAHLTRTQPGRIGHEKLLPWAWVIANYGDPRFDDSQPFDPPNITTPEMTNAARRALACGELKELLDSVREPLTWSRFWSNLTGAVSRTRLVIPADPVEAKRKFCR